MLNLPKCLGMVIKFYINQSTLWDLAEVWFLPHICFKIGSAKKYTTVKINSPQQKHRVSPITGNPFSVTVNNKQYQTSVAHHIYDISIKLHIYTYLNRHNSITWFALCVFLDGSSYDKYSPSMKMFAHEIYCFWKWRTQKKIQILFHLRFPDLFYKCRY